MSDRYRLTALKRKVDERRKETNKVRKKNEEKRKNKKLDTKPVMMVDEKFCLVNYERKITSTDVFYWFKEGIRKYDIDKNTPIQEWTIHQKTLASELLKVYGPELMEKTVDYFCKNWDVIVERSNNRFDGRPTINLMWTLRERLFTNANLDKELKPLKKKEDRNKNEFKGKDGCPDIGW